MKPHGTTGRYRKGCRCDKCVAVQRAQWKAARERRREQPVPEHVHGTWNGYTNYGCKCSRCLQACRERYPYQQDWRDANRERLNQQRRDYYYNVVKPREAQEEAERKKRKARK